jgi:ParB family chromosome partitioning protein
VLIDGYRRIAALRRIGRDTASVDRWACDVTDALLGLLARTQNRPFASIEEALLIRELMQGLGLSQHDLARRCGRDVSWVNRRLQLLSGLPDAALTAVRDGRLSSWAANRVVVPLARANPGGGRAGAAPQRRACRSPVDGTGRCAVVDARVA